MLNFIFDLDHTVIDSSHRQLTRADGSLDLEHWIDNCTREKIFADSLLPLASRMRGAIAAGNSVIVCTARVMGADDYDFLAANGLAAPVILSRPLGDRTSDHLLKERLLREHCQSVGQSFARFCSTAIIWDDNQKVLAHLKSLDIRTVCAIRTNKLLTAAA